VPHYLPGQNPEADFMTRPTTCEGGALGYAESLYPEYAHAEEHLHAARVVRTLLLRLDRAPGTARRGAGLACNDGGLERSTRSCGASRKRER